MDAHRGIDSAGRDLQSKQRMYALEPAKAHVFHRQYSCMKPCPMITG
jgi:hypothetical protein